MGRMDDDILKVLYTEEEIAARIREMGAAMYRDLEGKDPLFISVLRGAFVFMADIVRFRLTAAPPSPPARCRSPTTSSRTSPGGTWW